jgi:hypothetical protein
VGAALAGGRAGSAIEILVLQALALQDTVKTTPRPIVRTFWIAQRAIVRFSRGRIGLATPEAASGSGC